MVGKGVAIQLGVWEQEVVRLCETAILSATSGLSRRITVRPLDPALIANKNAAALQEAALCAVGRPRSMPS